MAGSSERPILDELIERSRDRFWQDRSPHNNVDESASFVVSQLNIVDPIDLMTEVLRQTTLNGPEDLLMADQIIEGRGWEEFCVRLIRQIVAEELLRHYPDIEQEDDENRTAAPPKEKL